MAIIHFLIIGEKTLKTRESAKGEIQTRKYKYRLKRFVFSNSARGGLCSVLRLVELTLTDAKGGQWVVGSHLIPHSTNANHKCNPLLRPLYYVVEALELTLLTSEIYFCTE